MRRLLPLVCFAALFLAACGGGSDLVTPGGTTPPPATNPPPAGTPEALTASITPPGQPTLAANTSIVVQFSAPVATASLQLAGSFTALNPVTSWSADNTTLTLAPPAGGWPRGQGGTLSVLATGAAGGAMAAAATASFFVPTQFASGQAAFAAIGQADLATGTAQPVSASTVRSPQGNVAVADGRLFVSDWNNHRILGFPAVPATSNAAADIVLGQPDFVTGAPRATARDSLNGPMQVSIAAGKMAVADLNNSRVLVWSTVPSASGALPDVVLGQVDFNAAVTFGCTATRIGFPESVVITPDGKLVVADTNNQRVLLWNTVPTANTTPPDLVLGQGDFTHCRRNDDNQDGTADATPSDRTMWRPSGLWSDGQRLVVLDSSNHRALVWNTFPTANFQRADLVLGQGSFTRVAPNDDNQDGVTDAPTARTLNAPYNGVDSNGMQLAIADTSNHRVLVWNTFPTTSFQPADAVLGQANFTTNAAGTAADRVNLPHGVKFVGDKLLVNDRFNNRVLVLQSP
ncbi:hypothetical protein [Ramlibacter pallidus]|uniref:SbsA Ig-like domain-containing protein n=1 Tax=Ramlibacter pallidus TaxID=2780087 RepID=A0ABR9S209_9BURK|nr:hypothetical protein [Ramlibacter pallidus]MBE7367538.1 hypothetical protein [Ramlibacter pallidus]